MIYADGQWLVDEILTASKRASRTCKARGVDDQHYYEDEEDEEGEEEPEGAQDETESETQSGDQ